MTPELDIPKLRADLKAATPGKWEIASGATYQNGKVTSTEWFIRLPEDDVAIATYPFGQTDSVDAAVVRWPIRIREKPRQTAGPRKWITRTRPYLEMLGIWQPHPLQLTTSDQNSYPTTRPTNSCFRRRIRQSA